MAGAGEGRVRTGALNVREIDHFAMAQRPKMLGSIRQPPDCHSCILLVDVSGMARAAGIRVGNGSEHDLRHRWVADVSPG